MRKLLGIQPTIVHLSNNDISIHTSASEDKIEESGYLRIYAFFSIFSSHGNRDGPNAVHALLQIKAPEGIKSFKPVIRTG